MVPGSLTLTTGGGVPNLSVMNMQRPEYQHLTALCVEDEPLVSIELTRVLKELGFGCVHSAFRLSVAFDHMKAGKVDLALLDYDLGFGEFTSDLGLALKDQGAVVIFSSGYAQSELDARLHGFPFVEKPAMARVLIERIDALMGGTT